jgi:ribosomal-protein-alanine N-acetyltransferase
MKGFLIMNVRWLMKSDLDMVLAIDMCVREYPTDREALVEFLSMRNAIGIVAESDNMVAGYCLYRIFHGHIFLDDLAVLPECQRQGVGTTLANKMKSKLTGKRRKMLVINVRESNLKAQLFFKSMGFNCDFTYKGFYGEDVDAIEDAYRFVYAPAKKWSPVNRIASLVNQNEET